MKMKQSILTKFLAAFVTMIVIPIFIIGAIVFRSYAVVLLESSAQKTDETLNQIAVSFDNQSRSLSTLLSALSFDSNVLHMLSSWHHSEGEGDRYELSKHIDQDLVNVFNYISGVNSIIFFFRDGGYYYYGNMPGVSDEEMRSSAWYQDTLNNDHQSYLLNSLDSVAYNYKNNHFLSAAVNPSSVNFSNDVELIYISVSTNVLKGYYASQDAVDANHFLLLDGSDNIIMSQTPDLIGQQYNIAFDYSKQENITKYSSLFLDHADRRVVVSQVRVPKNNWKIVTLTDYEVVTKSIDIITNIAFWLAFLIILLFLFFTFTFLKGIILPVKALINEMKKVEKGNFQTSVSVRGKDELFQLGATFNKMVVEIQNLMVERDTKERERSNAEIAALQAQINPHFIANTLSSIRFMAMVAKMDSIKDMTEAFIKIVSATFRRDSIYSTVEKELELLKNYVYIMRVRHGNKYDVTMEASEDARGLLILKMLIQPLLENAILHGVNDLEKKGIITIHFTKEQSCLLVQIRDNGEGMLPEQIKKLLSEYQSNTKGFSSMGVMNVDKRIKLNHGEDYGLKIDSKRGEYTLVQVRLPILAEEANEETSNKTS